MKKQIVFLLIFAILIISIVLVSSGRFDLNNDGNVTILDLQLLASHYEGKTTYNSTFDLNNDSKIDLFDIVSVARQINTNISSSGNMSKSNSSLYSHMPSGMTIVGEDNGDVISSTGIRNTGHAFNITNFGNWWRFGGGTPNVTIVNDSTSPSGSGKALRFDYEEPGDQACLSQQLNFQGPWHQFYVALSIYYEPGYFSEVGGAKIYYFAPNISAQVNTGLPTDWYIQTNPIHMSMQHGGTSHHGTLNITGDDSTPTGQWLNWEFLAVAESTPGAGDGYFTIWKNGNLVSNETGIQWLNPTDSPNGFNGMEWYALSSPKITMDRYYRLGHLIIAGKN